MHNHNKVNYNDEFLYQNIEWNIHLLSDLEKCKQNTMHEWCTKQSNLIKITIHDRNENIKKNINYFSDDYLSEFNDDFNNIILGWMSENKVKPYGHYTNK